ncbi:ABC transporter permease [Streptacidiphilus sp. ASG 303]|uniref:ABC transporter permease n=1 Tax=Streptacidiphilus sp. ASG 303 TaxID=2896847 RepID=UPI001E2BC946|nr:ABC transporter permease [Streptacidiphilus sp. ASG 303]MCD0485853.1 ABC transporter permease [Streptacidiphilus sp. ASG 303]
MTAAMWTRSAMAYRTSFVLMTVGNLAATGMDFVVIALMFRHTGSLGGWGLREVAFLYGTAGLAMGLADLLVGSIDKLGERIRLGTLDVVLVRPAPALAQMAADRFALRRIGRPLQASAVLAWALAGLHVDWTWDRVLLLPVMAVCGTVIFASLFVAGSCLQFWAADAAEVQNTVTYGGATLLQYPPTVFARELVAGTVFGVPLAFVNWLPALHVLGRPDPLHLPEAFRFASPAAAALAAAAAGLLWRAGLRSYRGTGS